jgi:hypothetical protein
MESIKVKQYKNDPKSFFTYLGSARVKEIAFQNTESPDLKLLDIVFETDLEDHHPAEFLIRLETPMAEVRSLLKKLIQAIKYPVPHPWDEDKFDKAVTGKTVRERNEERIKNMAVPEGLEKCPTCGEYKGKAKCKDLNWDGNFQQEKNEKSEDLLEFTCWCESILCSKCGKGRIRRPNSNHYIEETNSLAHTPLLITWGGCSECKRQRKQERSQERKERIRKRKEEFKEAETHHPDPTFAPRDSFGGMRPSSCVGPHWVRAYGLPRFYAMLDKLDTAGQYEKYVAYFKELWERRKATPPAECDPAIISKIDAFTDNLRATKGGIFGE